MSSAVKVRQSTPDDLGEWLRMSQALFPDERGADIERGMREFSARPDTAVFIAERPNGTSCGFVEVGTRSYADGCETSPVAYIEAWYVDQDVRKMGYGRALLAAAEAWARRAGYREIASDALLDNSVSHQAHLRSGYQEVDRVVQYRKTL